MSATMKSLERDIIIEREQRFKMEKAVRAFENL